MRDVAISLKRDKASLQLHGQHGSMRLLRQVFYSARAPAEPERPSVRLNATPNDPQQAAGLAAAQQLAAQLAWWIAPGISGFVLGQFLRWFVRDRCGLPIYPCGARCMYTPRVSGVMCNTPLDATNLHSQACCHSVVQARHHAVRDWIADCMRDIHWHVGIEQEVRIAVGPVHEQEDDACRPTTKRADIIATQPSGQQLILDVAITSSSAAGNAADDVDKVQMQKCRLYGVTCERRNMVGGEMFCPLCMS